MTLVPPIPPQLERLGRRPFRFSPPILNAAQNRWLFRRATWGELVVQNTQTKEEVSVPRRFLGEVSWANEALPSLALTKEMELREGALWPAGRRVIEMPRAVNEGPRPHYEASQPAPVIGIRLENSGPSRVGRMVVGGTALGIAGCLLAVTLSHGGIIGNRALSAPVMQSGLGLHFRDDYSSVVRRFGAPAEDRWMPGPRDMHYRVLDYPDEGLYIVLMGRTLDQAHFIGALDRNWQPAAAVRLPSGGSAYTLLRELKRY